MPVPKGYELPKAHGHELLENFSPAATVAVVVLVSFWLFEEAVAYLGFRSGWARQLPSMLAIGMLFGAFGLSERVAFRDAMGRWRYLAAFGIVFWLGTIYQAR